MSTSDIRITPKDITDTFPHISHNVSEFKNGQGQKEKRFYFNIGDGQNFKRKVRIDCIGVGYTRKGDPKSFQADGGNDPEFRLKLDEEDMAGLQRLDDRLFDYAWAHRAEFWPKQETDTLFAGLSEENRRTVYRERERKLWTSVLDVRDATVKSGDEWVLKGDGSKDIKIKLKVKAAFPPKYIYRNRSVENSETKNLEQTDVGNRKVNMFSFYVSGFRMGTGLVGCSKRLFAMELADRWEKSDPADSEPEQFTGFLMDEPTATASYADFEPAANSDPMSVETEDGEQSPKRQKVSE